MSDIESLIKEVREKHQKMRDKIRAKNKERKGADIAARHARAPYLANIKKHIDEWFTTLEKIYNHNSHISFRRMGVLGGIAAVSSQYHKFPQIKNDVTISVSGNFNNESGSIVLTAPIDEEYKPITLFAGTTIELKNQVETIKNKFDKEMVEILTLLEEDAG